MTTQPGFHSQDSAARIPQPGLHNQDSTARTPQAGLSLYALSARTLSCGHVIISLCDHTNILCDHITILHDHITRLHDHIKKYMIISKYYMTGALLFRQLLSDLMLMHCGYANVPRTLVSHCSGGLRPLLGVGWDAFPRSGGPSLCLCLLASSSLCLSILHYRIARYSLPLQWARCRLMPVWPVAERSLCSYVLSFLCLLVSLSVPLAPLHSPLQHPTSVGAL